MAVALAIFGVTFAAFCVWLSVRIVNRRENWAKRLAVVLVVVLAAYPLSWGPAISITARSRDSTHDAYREFYSPITWIYWNGPDPVHDALFWYAALWQ
jgi:hypothetical protein